MRIGFVAQPFDRLVPPVQDGSLAIWIYQVARRCADRGHEVFVTANHGGSLRAGGATDHLVRYLYTPTGPNSALNRTARAWHDARRRVGLNGGRPLPEFAADWRDAGYARSAAHALTRTNCDAVLVMNYSQFVPVIRRTSPRMKICLYMQCEWLTQLDRNAMAARMDAADLVSGCSEYITRSIVARFPEHAGKCVTINNAGTSVAAGQRTDREPGHVLFVGRVSPEKGVHVLIDAFHQVIKWCPAARLHVVGGAGSAPLEYLVGLSDDPHVSALRRFYEGAGANGKDPYLAHLERAAGDELGRRIFFDGRVDHDRITAAYRAASLLVNPSLSESFGMTLVEAMMHGVPVVATRVGGMPYIVDHRETGLLVPAADSGALASAICEMLADAESSQRMGDAGRLRAQTHFSWDCTADSLLEHLAAAVRTP